MAERRMFSRRIIKSARFLKMPSSTQNLYFHLGMDADDDGVVEAYNVMNITGASEDDLKVLCAKGFVCVLNEDLVSYITDWKENNKIRADRKIDSIYKDLLLKVLPDAQLQEAKGRADRPPRIPEPTMGQPWDDHGTSRGQPWDDHGTSRGQPWDRIGEDRIVEGRVGQYSVGKGREGEGEFSPTSLPPVDNSDPAYYEVKPLGGSVGKGVVKLSEYQMELLLERMSIANFDKYCDIVAAEELAGHNYTKKSHFQAIIDMATQDGVIRKE